MVNNMRGIALIPIIMAILLLVQPAVADCKYKLNKDGYPFGIIPSVKEIRVDFNEPKQQNYTFNLYIESEAGTTTALDCRVALSVENETIALDIELSNYSLETGIGFIERPITVIMTPTNLVNFPDVIKSQIKIYDVDFPRNYAVVPIFATYKFARQKPSPSIKPSPSPSATPAITVTEGISPTPTNNTLVDTVISSVEDGSSKYIIAVVAFFFLAALLWVGFNSLQRE